VSLYSNVVNRGGQEGFFVFGLESGMLGVNASTLPAAPSLLLAGYGSLPGIDVNDNPQPVRGVGSYRPLDFILGRREITVEAALEISGGANAKMLLHSMFRSSPTSSIPSGNRFMCQPTICIGGGAVGACDATRSYHWLARYFMPNTYSMTMAIGQPATLQFQGNALVLVENATALTTTTVNDTNLIAAGGTPFAWQNLEFLINGVDYTGMLLNATFQGSNNTILRGMRTLASVGGDATNPLYRAAQQITPGVEDLSIQLALEDKLPSTLYGLLGVVSGSMSDGVSTISVSTAINILANKRQNQTTADSPFSYGATILSSQISVN
jgi:hypothetical protein